MENKPLSDFFISHASEDKDETARPLAEVLRHKGYTVWYDEFVLRLGQSLRAEIDKGLATCKYGVVILSPAFFAKAWPQAELNGLFARETIEGRNVILPVWYNIDQKGIAQYSPILADKYAALFSKGLDSVVNQILSAIEAEKEAEATVQKRTMETTISELDTIRWDRVANLWWFCHDLLETFRWLLSGIDKESIDVGFRQCCHHATELNLYDDIIDRLKNVRDQSSSTDYLTPNQREDFAREIRIVFNVVAQLTQKQQERLPDGFDSGPG